MINLNSRMGENYTAHTDIAFVAMGVSCSPTCCNNCNIRVELYLLKEQK